MLPSFSPSKPSLLAEPKSYWTYWPCTQSTAVDRLPAALRPNIDLSGNQVLASPASLRHHADAAHDTDRHSAGFWKAVAGDS